MSSYISALVVLTIVLIGNALGPSGSHISMKYFDSVLHLLAGVGLGFFFCALTSSLWSRRWYGKWKVVMLVFAAGIVWEIFEAYFGITGYALWSTMYYLDTAKDMLLDVAGAWLVVHIIIKK